MSCVALRVGMQQAKHQHPEDFRSILQLGSFAGAASRCLDIHPYGHGKDAIRRWRLEVFSFILGETILSFKEFSQGQIRYLVDQMKDPGNWLITAYWKECINDIERLLDEADSIEIREFQAQAENQFVLFSEGNTGQVPSMPDMQEAYPDFL